MEDLISRKDALEAVNKFITPVPMSEDEFNYNKALLCAKKAITQLPSVVPSDDFLEFLFQVINPNRMETYLSMYRCIGEATDE